MSVTHLDPAQALRNSYDDASQSLRVNLVDAATGPNVVGSYAVAFGSINGSGGAVYEISAAVSGAVSLIVPNEQTGTALNLYTGAAGLETLLCIIAPGQDNEVPVAVATGARFSVRAVGASAPAAGTFYLTLCG